MEDFVEGEEEVVEMTRMLQQSGLEKAHQHMVSNKFQMIKEIDYKKPDVDYMPDRGRRLLMILAYEKRKAEADRQRQLNERSRYI